MLDTSKIYTSKASGDFKVVNYFNAKKVEVEFVSTCYRVITQAGNVRRGNIMDRLAPSIYGVGVIGVGDYIPTKNSKQTKQYQTWTSMLRRCYCIKFQATCPTYKGCSVVAEWHNFQVFAKWFDENYMEGFQLDKDIKIEGNKIYSSGTCLFVSPTNNKVKARAKTFNFVSPLGDVVGIYNLAEFCRENELNKSNMYQVHFGRISHHKQWRKANTTTTQAA